MVTLTFDPKRVFPVSQSRAAREAWWWCTSLGRLFRRPVGWLYATERGRGGLWHAHVLVIGVEGVSWEAPVKVWEERNGVADVRPVWEGRGAVLYTTKIVRKGGEVTVSDTLIRYREHVRPRVVVGLCRDEEQQQGGEVMTSLLNKTAAHGTGVGMGGAQGVPSARGAPTEPGVTQCHNPAPNRHEVVLAELLGIVRRIEMDFLAVADLLLEAHERSYWVKWGYVSEEEAWEERLGLGRRTAYRLLAVARMMNTLALAGLKQAREAVAEVGSTKAAMIAPVVERTGDWRTWTEQARAMSREALAEAVAKALGRRLRQSGEPGDRFRNSVINAMPDLETRELADEFFAVGARVTGSQNPVGIMIAGFQESLATWSTHLREEPSEPLRNPPRQ